MKKAKLIQKVFLLTLSVLLFISGFRCDGMYVSSAENGDNVVSFGLTSVLSLSNGSKTPIAGDYVSLDGSEIIPIICDTYVSQDDKPGEHKNETKLVVGRENKIENRIYLKIGLPSSLKKTDKVYRAELCLPYSYAQAQGGPFDLYSVTELWNENDICFDNQPNSTLYSTGTRKRTNYGELPSTLEFDVTDLIRDIISGKSENLGVMIKNTSSKSSYYDYLVSAEHIDASRRPYLRIWFEDGYESENNNTLEKANILPLSYKSNEAVEINGSVSKTDTDWFSFFPARHGRIKISLSHLVGNDVDITLCNSKGRAIKSNIYRSVGEDETIISFINTRDGYTDEEEAYYLKITSKSAENVDYKLSVGFAQDYRELNWAYPAITYGREPLTYISSSVGYRETPNVGYHHGIDIPSNGNKNCLIVSMCQGEIVRVFENSRGYGNCIVVKSDYIDPYTGENLYIWYMHLQCIATNPDSRAQWKVGDRVINHSFLGPMGSSGKTSNGVHLHIEINCYDDRMSSDYKKLLNPIDFFNEKISLYGYVYYDNN